MGLFKLGNEEQMPAPLSFLFSSKQPPGIGCPLVLKTVQEGRRTGMPAHENVAEAGHSVSHIQKNRPSAIQAGEGR